MKTAQKANVLRYVTALYYPLNALRRQRSHRPSEGSAYHLCLSSDCSNHYFKTYPHGGLIYSDDLRPERQLFAVFLCLSGRVVPLKIINDSYIDLKPFRTTANRFLNTSAKHNRKF